MKKNKKYILLLLLLACVGVLGYYFFLKEKKISMKNFTQQGQTEISSGNIVLKVWDNFIEDGDSIQVFFDGKLIADSLGILNKPVEYQLGHLSAGEYWLGVKAINEGMMGPASPHLSLNNGEIVKALSMDAWIDSAASWKVIIK